MQWFLLSLLAGLNCESKTESTVFPSYLLYNRAIYSKQDDNDSRPSVTNFHSKDGILDSDEETVGLDRKKRYSNLEFDQLSNSFDKSFLISKRFPRWLGHSEPKQNIRRKRSVPSSIEEIGEERDELSQNVTDKIQNYELQLNSASEVSTVIDQKPFVVDSPSEPAPHVYKDEFTDEIIVNSRTSTNAETTSLTSDVNLYTDVQYNDKEGTSENVLNVPDQDSFDNIDPSSYELSNPPEDSKLSVNLPLDTVHDSKPPYVETPVDTLPALTGQDIIGITTTPIRPGYPEVILPEETKAEVTLPKVENTEIINNRPASPPKTLPSEPIPFRKAKPKLPFVTPFNPYTTLFLPSSGSHLYHLPLQIPILNLPVNNYY